MARRRGPAAPGARPASRAGAQAPLTTLAGRARGGRARAGPAPDRAGGHLRGDLFVTLRARRRLCRDLLGHFARDDTSAATCSCRSRRRHLRRRLAHADLGGGISGGDLPVQISAEASTAASPVVQPGAGGISGGDLLVQISPEVTPAAIGSNRSSPEATSAAPQPGTHRGSGAFRAPRADAAGPPIPIRAARARAAGTGKLRRCGCVCW